MQRQVLADRFLAYQTFLYRLAYSHLQNRMDAEDAVQSAFMRAWVYCDTIQNDNVIFTWLSRILINECYNIQRKQQHRHEIFIGDSFQHLSIGYQEDRILFRIDFHQALCDLEDRYRIPIQMIFFYGLTSEETAARLHKTRSAVSGMVRRGKDRLRAAM